MTQWILDNLITIITSLFGGGSFLAYTKERRKRRIEEKQLGADALSRMQEAYDRFTADSLEQYTALRKEVDELKKKLADVQQSLKAEKSRYTRLKQDYDTLRKNYDKLKKEFETYKSQHHNE